DDHVLVAAGADADDADPGTGELLQPADVGLGVGRQVLEPTAAGDVLPPAGQLLVHRGGVVEVGLRHRHLVVPHSVDVVGDADRDGLQAGQHIQLGEEVVGDAVDPAGVPGHDGV